MTTNELLQPSEIFPAPVTLQGATKSELLVHSKSIVDKVLEYGNALQVAEYMKQNEELAAMIRADKRFPDAVREDAGKYGKGGYTAPSGTKIKLAEVGTKYDYSQCGCPILAELEEHAKQAAAQLKQRQELLKCLPSEGDDFVDLQTGDTHKIYPPTKTSTSSYTVEIAK